MDSPRKGLTTALKIGIVVVIIIIVGGAVYLIPSPGGGSQVRASQSGAITSNVGTNQTRDMLALLGPFPKMQLSLFFNDAANQNTQNQTFSYTTLPKASLGSVEYTRIEFMTVGIGNAEIVWFNPSSGIDRVDVLGQRNYTGSGAYALAQTYTSSFSLISVITNNSTLPSMLNKTSESTTSIGPTQVDLTTYTLPKPTSPYSVLTVKYATIPGTNLRLAVYLDQATTDGSTTLLQVTSLTH